MLKLVCSLASLFDHHIFYSEMVTPTGMKFHVHIESYASNKGEEGLQYLILRIQSLGERRASAQNIFREGNTHISSSKFPILSFFLFQSVRRIIHLNSCIS